MTLQADHLILEALKEDISSEDVTTNAVMKEAVKGEVELICKEDGIIAGLHVFKRVFELLDSQVMAEFILQRRRSGHERPAHGKSNRGYPGALIGRAGGAELSAENEWNCNLYAFRSGTPGKNEDKITGYKKDHA